MKKSCIYYEYFGDYGMNICNHPSKKNDHAIYDGDCKKCKMYCTADILKPCPFCGKKVSLANYHGKWHVVCNKCSLEMTDKTIDDLVEKWNNRK